MLALYGHVDAGTYWEDYCTEKVLECGWEKIPNWPSTFHHPKKHAFMIVYVDDFKLACKAADAKGLWRDLRSKIRLSEPEPPSRFLGCYQTRERMKVKDLAQFLENHPDSHPRSSVDPVKLRLDDPEKEVEVYIQHGELLVQECRQVLRDGGVPSKSHAGSSDSVRG